MSHAIAEFVRNVIIGIWIGALIYELGRWIRLRVAQRRMEKLSRSAWALVAHSAPERLSPWRDSPHLLPPEAWEDCVCCGTRVAHGTMRTCPNCQQPVGRGVVV